MREHGSGNLGATNAFRTLGVKADLCHRKYFKRHLMRRSHIYCTSPFILFSQGGAVIGHVFPCSQSLREAKP
ncbi:glycerol-3-phosphate acyltransferase [Bacillus velezensis]|nr:glycerol-3-phosphate acyltransferase [Bacillus velezensis]